MQLPNSLPPRRGQDTQHYAARVTNEPDNVTPLERWRRGLEPSDQERRQAEHDGGAGGDEPTIEGTVRRYVTVDVRMSAMWESFPHSPGTPKVGDLVTTLVGNRMWVGRVVSLEPLNANDPSRDGGWKTPLVELPHKSPLEDTGEWYGHGRDPRPGRPLEP